MSPPASAARTDSGHHGDQVNRRNGGRTVGSRTSAAITCRTASTPAGPTAGLLEGRCQVSVVRKPVDDPALRSVHIGDERVTRSQDGVSLVLGHTRQPDQGIAVFHAALIALDRSAAEAALVGRLPGLRALGVRRLVLAHVLQVGDARIPPGDPDELVPWLEGHAAPLREAGFEVSVSVSRGGLPAEDLLAMARRSSCDLVVVGSRSHSRVREVFLGSVARDLIRATDRAVLLLHLESDEVAPDQPGGAAPDQFLDRVLLATDLSHQSHAAEEAAISLAPSSPCVDVLSVRPDGGDDPSVEEHHGRVQALAARIGTTGTESHPRVANGDATTTIAEVAAEGYTLVIVGKHGRHWIADKIVGSTSIEVSRTSRRPVLVVPLPGKRDHPT
jgi:nucleotide-binding universal stress UspA family protein